MKKTVRYMITNIAYSLIFIHFSSVCMEDNSAKDTPPSGLRGFLYAQSFILSKPQLVLYAFEHNLFETNNKDHKSLLK